MITDLETSDVLHKRIPRLSHEIEELILLNVFVLIQKIIDGIHNDSGVVLYAEFDEPATFVRIQTIIGMFFQRGVLLLDVRLIGSLRQRR